MNIGALFVGLAALALLVAYAAQPFRRRSATDLDTVIEGWVQQARRQEPQQPGEATALPRDAGEQDVTPGGANFCHRCGARVDPTHRFCPRCGTRLAD